MNPVDITLKSPIDHFYHWEKERPDSIFLRQPFGNTWTTLTYAEAGQEARKMAAFLKTLDLENGDHIGIFSKNCYHWILADLAIMMGGFVSVPYYASLPKAQLAEVIEKSDIKLLFVGKLDQWGDRAEAVPSNVQIIRFPHYPGNAEVNQGLLWTDCTEKQAPLAEDYRPALDDLWTILFTSGTTGSPKGVMHSFKNPALIIKGEKEEDFVGLFRAPAQKYFSFLPLNHVAERIGVEISCLSTGGMMSFAESIDTFAQNLQDTQPTILFAVPRIWTKFYLGVLSKMPKKRLDFLFKLPIISNLVKKRLLKALGLGEAQIVATGAAITPAYLKKWYANLGIHLVEAYGMTEVCGAISYGTTSATPNDSVGTAAPLCEVKIDEETGEILMRTAHAMIGYYKEPEKTAEVLIDGWIHSGDRGTVDAQGYIRVVGRVKDAFKTTKGQFIVPNPMEEKLSKNDFVEQVCITGRTLPQPIALVNLSDLGKMADQKEVFQSLQDDLDQINTSLSGYQKISTIVINKMAWSEENKLLTPTLKVRRGHIDDYYGAHLEQWHESKTAVIWE
ncbi:MAG: AMP-binding protein [Bacteroidota bacterium]